MIQFFALVKVIKNLPKEVWIVTFVLTLGLFAWWRIHQFGDARYEAGRNDLLREQVLQIEWIDGQRAEVTERVVIEYRDRIVEIEQAAEVIIREVPVYVTVQDDSNCTINRGFVRLWNDSNKGYMSLPGTAGGVDDSPSDVRLSDVATQKATESRNCRVTEQRLISLQEWVRQQGAVE